MLKTCSKCGIEKPATKEFFYGSSAKKDGLRADCKVCWKRDYSEQKKEYYQAHREDTLKYLKSYRIENAEALKEKRRKYLKDKKVKARISKYYRSQRAVDGERFREYSRKSYVKHKDRKAKYEKSRRKNDLQYRIACVLRSRVNKVVKAGYKSASTLELLGCSVQCLKEHLEKQFKPDMTWDNYGSYWHIDHIRPCASFDLTKSEEQRRCFHYLNLQPLEAVENIRKGAKWSGSDVALFRCSKKG